MRWLRLLAILPLPLLSACGHLGAWLPWPQAQEPAPAAEMRTSRPAACTRLERDLTQAWGQRGYWCAPPGYRYVARQPMPLEPVAAPPRPDAETTTRVRFPLPFAGGSLVLGPQGRSLLSAYLQRVRRASSVRLRGFAPESERERERMAVGRALAVKDALTDAGLAPVAISILDAGTAGARVDLELEFSRAEP